MSKRFVIEGEWSGYTSAQRRVVHRTVHSSSPRLRKWCDTHGLCVFSDGTTLHVTARDCTPRERVKVINAYTSLILDAVFSTEKEAA